jgi:DNA polymerase
MADRQLEYLQAIGVDVWVRKVAPAPVSAVATPAPESVPPAAEGDSNPRTFGRLERVLSQPSLPPSAPSVRVPFPSSAGVATRTPATDPLTADEDAQWSALTAEILACTKCALHSTRTQGVPGVGNRRAEWLIIGEAPGAEEDRRGEPFVGRAGQLLNAMLKAIGLEREQVFIANVLKSRPPSNRDPKPDEVTACLPYLMRQIALLRPRLMLAVGRIAAQNLLATDVALGRLRGQVHTFGELNTPLIVTYHPAYLLRSPADKRKAWEDLKFARSTFQRLASQDP